MNETIPVLDTSVKAVIANYEDKSTRKENRSGKQRTIRIGSYSRRVKTKSLHAIPKRK